MLTNDFKMAWRQLVKRKFYTALSVLGLSVGMAFLLLIGSFVWGELRVNTQLRRADHQYLLQSTWKQAAMGMDITTLAPLGRALKENYPRLVANYYRFDGISATVSKGTKHFREDIQLGDSTLLSMYGFPLLAGDAATALSQPNSLVIPAELAVKYFGKTDVVGESLTLDSFSGQKQEFMITAVLDKVPQNSVLNLLDPTISPLLVPESSLAFFGRGDFSNWANVYIVNYLELQEGVTPADLAGPMAQLLKTHAPAAIQENLEVYLNPLKAYYRQANNGLVQKTLLTLTAVAGFILLMAVVNFINLSIGHSSTRLKEIGVRKVLGSRKRQVARQFLVESVLMAWGSMLLSWLLYQLGAGYFGEVLGRPIPSLVEVPPTFYLVSGLLALLLGVLAGSYPALVLASLPSVASMKGTLVTVRENILFRRLLVGAQFTVALFVFGAAVIVSQQVSYFFTKDLGYNKESVLTVALPRDWSPEGVLSMETIREEMRQLPEVGQASFSYEIPNGKNGFSLGVYPSGRDSTQAIYVPVLQTDERFAETYQIPLRAGTFFHAAEGTFRPGQVVLNDAATKALGYASAEAALGQKVYLQPGSQELTVAGVLQDFHFTSLHEAIKPLMFMHVRDTNTYRFLSLRLQPASVSKAVAVLEKRWNQLLPDAPFTFHFLDDTLQTMYQSEIRLQKASRVATVLALVMVLLGILGMVSLSVARRTRELGIRKVLGASGVSIVLLFLKEFLALMILALVVAFPLVVVSMNRWLGHYAYRVELSWLTLGLVALAFGLVIVLIVGVQTAKAALMNPVKSLRSE
ncbi:ABC transporter permease [Rhabdobacter roseus]|uniref:Putative ABC transport system permease protein n=1 Tax=Rhabdobacter roseus TaxID=1655419 RepID=A0A840TQP1_9BACT|nr:ABC transporter permease [Rhabdobacter roseus]MBB5285644.1 putative ABC transport system permease protein [Rhabdobacter roseus]